MTGQRTGRAPGLRSVGEERMPGLRSRFGVGVIHSVALVVRRPASSQRLPCRIVRAMFVSGDSRLSGHSTLAFRMDRSVFVCRLTLMLRHRAWCDREWRISTAPGSSLTISLGTGLVAKPYRSAPRHAHRCRNLLDLDTTEQRDLAEAGCCFPCEPWSCRSCYVSGLVNALRSAVQLVFYTCSGARSHDAGILQLACPCQTP